MCEEDIVNENILNYVVISSQTVFPPLLTYVLLWLFTTAEWSCVLQMKNHFACTYI